jgi:hypothetical protein
MNPTPLGKSVLKDDTGPDRLGRYGGFLFTDNEGIAKQFGLTEDWQTKLADLARSLPVLRDGQGLQTLDQQDPDGGRP